ncbi:MAG: helix-turn-helix transcriptional regulator [Gemmatimonadales bacterium]
MSHSKQESLTPLSAAILFALADGASHGYAIIKEIEEITHGEMRPNTGSMYLALHRLLQEGFITEATGPRDDARRRYYSLSREGRVAAKVEARRLAQLVRVASAKKLIPRTAL